MEPHEVVHNYAEAGSYSEPVSEAAGAGWEPSQPGIDVRSSAAAIATRVNTEMFSPRARAASASSSGTYTVSRATLNARHTQAFSRQRWLACHLSGCRWTLVSHGV